MLYLLPCTCIVPCMLLCLMPYMVLRHTFLVPYWPTCSRALRIPRLTCLVSYVSLCLTRSVSYVTLCPTRSTCSCASRALTLYVSLGFCAFCASSANIKSCAPVLPCLTWLLFQIYFQLVTCPGIFTASKIRIICRS